MTEEDEILEPMIAYATNRCSDTRLSKGRRRAWARRMAHLISQRTSARVAEMEREQGLQ